MRAPAKALQDGEGGLKLIINFYTKMIIKFTNKIKHMICKRTRAQLLNVQVICALILPSNKIASD
jgi:hypothetical protein